MCLSKFSGLAHADSPVTVKPFSRVRQHNGAATERHPDWYGATSNGRRLGPPPPGDLRGRRREHGRNHEPRAEAGRGREAGRSEPDPGPVTLHQDGGGSVRGGRRLRARHRVRSRLLRGLRRVSHPRRGDSRRDEEAGGRGGPGHRRRPQLRDHAEQRLSHQRPQRRPAVSRGHGNPLRDRQPGAGGDRGVGAGTGNPGGHRRLAAEGRRG